MTINKTLEGSSLLLELCGRLDTITSPLLETEIKESLKDIANLTLDFNNLVYLSSAGLRVILIMQKMMNKQGKMAIKNVNTPIMEIFEITGFVDILTFI